MNTHRKVYAHVAKATGCRACYKWLLDQGIRPGHTALIGDSAGDALAVTTILRAREQGAPADRHDTALALARHGGDRPPEEEVRGNLECVRDDDSAYRGGMSPAILPSLQKEGRRAACCKRTYFGPLQRRIFPGESVEVMPVLPIPGG